METFRGKNWFYQNGRIKIESTAGRNQLNKIQIQLQSQVHEITQHEHCKHVGKGERENSKH